MTATSASKHYWPVTRGLGRFRRSDRGAAAAEFALVLAVLVPALANAVDLGLYGFRRVQVELAAEAGVQAIRAACSPAQTPVTRNCATGLLTKVTTAVQSTSLGTSATVASGSPAEAYYCVNPSTGLVLLGSSGSLSAPPPAAPPSDCSGLVAGNNASPGDYVQVTVNYTYSPLFPAASVVSLLPSPITRTAWYRVR